MSELFTSGSVGGAGGNSCFYPATRIAIFRFHNGYLPAKKWVIVASLASPQSRNFKRYMAKIHPTQYHNIMVMH
jgi:hypothetical protein